MVEGACVSICDDLAWEGAEMAISLECLEGLPTKVDSSVIRGRG